MDVTGRRHDGFVTTSSKNDGDEDPAECLAQSRAQPMSSTPPRTNAPVPQVDAPVGASFERGGVRAPAGHLRTIVRGVAFASRPPEASPVRAGQLVRLLREPGNPADPLAVAVWIAEVAGTWRLGYLDRSVAAWVAPLIDAGEIATGVIDSWVAEPDGRWHRPLLRMDVTSTRYRRRISVRVDDCAAETPRLWGRPPGASRRTV